MTVETATKVSQLNATLPADGDSRSEGDNHMRTIKTAILGTLANADTTGVTGFNVVTQAAGNSTTLAASTEFVTSALVTLTAQDLSAPPPIGNTTPNTGAFTGLTLSANVAAPTAITPTITGISQGKGDNATFIGVSGGYLQSRDRTDVTGSNKGVLYGLQLSVAPRVARGNIPYDDATGIVVQNDALVSNAKATDAIYVGRNSTMFTGTNSEWLTGVTVDANVDYGFQTNGASYTSFSANGEMTGPSGEGFGFLSRQQVQTPVTTNAFQFCSQPSTVASAFALTSLYHFVAIQGTVGAGSSVTSQYGFHAGSTLSGATNNYGFFGALASGTGKYNLYMQGTADNYLAGKLAIGVVPTTGVELLVQKTLTGATAKQNISSVFSAASDVTASAAGFQTYGLTDGTAFSLTALSHFVANQGSFGSTTVGSQRGFWAQNTLTGGSNTYGFFGEIAAGSGKWNFYASGTARNYFAGGVEPLAGTTTQAAGFINISSASGAPTGAPTNPTGNVPLYYDTTNNFLYIYNGGWKKSTVYA